MNLIIIDDSSAINPNAVSIYNALVAFWDFEQNSAGTQWLDSHSTNHLSNYVSGSLDATSNWGSISGVVGRGYIPIGTPSGAPSALSIIPRTNTALDLANSDFSFGGWFAGLTSAAGSSRWIMGRAGGAGVATKQHAYLAIEGADDKVYFEATTDGAFSGRVQLSSGLGLSVTPSLLIGTFNRTSNQLEVRIRAAGAGSMTKTTVAFASALYTGADDANFAINQGVDGNTNVISGSRDALFMADSCFYASKAITDAEFDYLYNGGTGKNYAQLANEAGH